MIMFIPLMIGTTEILLLGGLALLLFGGKKLPEMMRGLGKGVKEFKEGMTGVQSQSSPEEQPSGNNGGVVEENSSEESE